MEIRIVRDTTHITEKNTMSIARTPAFYIANLGSEVSRLESALEKGDTEEVAGALRRVRGIFAKLLELPLRVPARVEVKILEEVIEDLPLPKRRFTVNAQSLESYFLPFARLVLAEKK